MIEESVEIVRKDGMEALNARSLAKALGCSVQPIFRAFDSMEELKRRVTGAVAEHYQNYLLESMKAEDSLDSLLFAYIRYAQEERQFFKLLHMSNRIGIKKTEDFTRTGINKTIVNVMAETAGLSTAKAEALYAGTFFAAHGIAVMLATNHCRLEEEEIREIVTNIYDGLILKLNGAEN